MAVEGKILYQGQPSTSDALLYEPSNVTAYIDGATICNPTGGAVTVTISVVKGGGAMADANKQYAAFSIGAGATETLGGLLNIRMESGDELRALASAATSLTLTISGREVS